MKKFEFFNPVRVIFGPGEFDRLGALTAMYGRRALLVTSKGPLEKMGVHKKAVELMRSAGLEVFELGGVEPNPKLSSVYEGIRICREKQVEVVIGIGGGSPIDCAKAIAVGAADSGDVWDFFTQKRSAVKALPVGAVSTLAATGAEMSVHCVISNEKTKQKYATHYEFNLPKFAIIDTELHKTVPRRLTACGLVDTITHAGENYFAGEKNTPVTDRIAEGLILTILENDGILNDLQNVEMRDNIAWAATLSINGLTDCGRGIYEYGAHMIEHAISGLFDVVHGEGLAIVHPAWLYYRCEREPRKFVQFAERVFGVPKQYGSEAEVGEKGITELKNRYKAWGLPTSLRQIGIEQVSYEEIADRVVQDPDSFIKDKSIVHRVLELCSK